ncbi:MAG: DsbA family protein [Stellaceae bacterium]
MPLPVRALLLALGLAALAFSAAGAAEPAALAPGQRQTIEAIVHDYLLSHPEVVVEALNEAEKKLRLAAQEHAQQALADHRRQVFDDPATPVGGNPEGDATIVEFFDYNCPYCKAIEPSLERLSAKDHNLRFVYKEFPVLGPESVVAARAALAANRQGKYEAFHDAMMALKGPFDDDRIDQVARSVGLDVARLRRDMASPQIAAALKANFVLADALDVHGTPTFIIGKEIVPGAVDTARLEHLIAAARRH